MGRDAEECPETVGGAWHSHISPEPDPAVPPPELDLPPAPVMPPEAAVQLKPSKRRKKTHRRSGSGSQGGGSRFKSEISVLDAVDIAFCVIGIIAEICSD